MACRILQKSIGIWNLTRGDSANWETANVEKSQRMKWGSLRSAPCRSSTRLRAKQHFSEGGQIARRKCFEWTRDLGQERAPGPPTPFKTDQLHLSLFLYKGIPPKVFLGKNSCSLISFLISQVDWFIWTSRRMGVGWTERRSEFNISLRTPNCISRHTQCPVSFLRNVIPGQFSFGKSTDSTLTFSPIHLLTFYHLCLSRSYPPKWGLLSS